MSKKALDRDELRGIAVSPGIACGEAYLHISGFPEYKEELISRDRIYAELKKVDRAFEHTLNDMERIKSQASHSDDLDLNGVLDAQILIVNDIEFKNQIKELVSSSLYSAIYAFTSAVNDNIELLSRSNDPYMREMVADIETVSNHILKYLLGERHKQLAGFEDPAILFASYFNPGEILEMPKLNVAGFVAERGGLTSHMGLFAKSLGIPAVIGVRADLKQIPTGSRIVVDGTQGLVVINPPDNEWKNFQRQAEEHSRNRFRRFEFISELPSSTTDSHRVEVMANLDLPTSLDEVLAHEHLGIGLYRTEFLYLRHTNFPTEQEQARIYKEIAHKFAPQPVILRTFDLGGDKLTDYFKSDFEDNPALGWRAIRFSLDVPRIFEDQIKGMLRASDKKNVQIMLPLITKLDEVRDAKAIIKDVIKEFKKKKVRFDQNIKIGIMIETPAAVHLADLLAKEVDFFSIGTNDLTQYSLAVDRTNLRVAKHFQIYHPAVLLSVKKTVEAAHKAGIPCGMCGELAGDPMATKLLVGLGLDTLSMNPSSIPTVKNILPHINFEEALEFASEVLKLATHGEIKEFLAEDYKKSFSQISVLRTGRV